MSLEDILVGEGKKNEGDFLSSKIHKKSFEIYDLKKLGRPRQIATRSRFLSKNNSKGSNREPESGKILVLP